MKRRYYLYTLLAATVLLFLLASARELWRYYAYAEERHAIMRLEGNLEIAGLGAIATQSRADTLRREIEAIDVRLRANRLELDSIEKSISTPRSARQFEEAYRRGIEFYNTEISQRNALFDRWRETVDSNHEYVGRYNLLADSIRHFATVMGEEHYPIKTPAEMATRYEELMLTAPQ
jgi:hypothetical protein